MQVPNDYSKWQRAVDGEKLSIDANEPWAGYYRVRRKGKEGYSPVAFWYDTHTDELRCHLDGSDFDRQRALEIWPYAAKSPVRFDDYSARINTGKWPGENHAVIGHNAAPVEDTPEALKDRVDDLVREAERLIAAGGASDQATADQASDLANTLSELEHKCADLHAAEKKPILEAGREIDRKWFDIRDVAAAVKTRLKALVITPWLVKRGEEAEKSATAAIAAGADPATVANPKVKAGSSKRSTALRTKKRAEVVDWPALLAELSEHPHLRITAQNIADQSAKAGVTLPGCKIIEEKVAV